MPKKIISFSLWGNQSKYLVGAIENVKLARTIYPGWICRFYVGRSTWNDMTKFMAELESYENTEIVKMKEDGNWEGMFWRFLPCSDKEVDVMLSRDADSRLSLREKSAVDEWLASDKLFHIIRDHPFHDVKILGGLWGAKKGAVPNMKQLIGNYSKGNFWQVDQNFLSEIIYPLIKDNVLIHDEFHGGKNILLQRNEFEFIGDSFDEHENRHPEYWKEVQKSERNKSSNSKQRLQNLLKKMARDNTKGNFY